jgi:hypothetical protein
MLEHSKIVALLQFGFPADRFFFVLFRIKRHICCKKAKRSIVARFLLLIFYF